jgi:hypothetical protein
MTIALLTRNDIVTCRVNGRFYAVAGKVVLVRSMRLVVSTQSGLPVLVLFI